MNVLKKLGRRAILASVGMALVGAVMAGAAAATPALAVSPIVATTTDAAASGPGLSAAGGDFTIQATKHPWHSHDGFKTVYAHGWYTRTSTRSTVFGHIRDKRSGEKYAGIYLKWTGKSSSIKALFVNPHHLTDARFRKPYYTHLTRHLYVAETLVKKIDGKWKVVNKGKWHKIY